MAKFNPKNSDPIDALILGEHPCAYIAGALLAQNSKLRIVRAGLLDEDIVDRLVTINPALSELHPMLGNLKKSIEPTNLFGLRFLSDKPETAGEFRSKSALILVARYSNVLSAIVRATETVDGSIERLPAAEILIHRVDETGIDLTIGKHRLRPTAIIVAGPLPPNQMAQLGMPGAWGPDIVHRFTSVICKAGKHFSPEPRMLMPMSLDLCGNLCWGWLLPGDGEFQLSVEQPIEKATAGSGVQLLEHWARVLKSHSVLGSRFELPRTDIQTYDRPLAGALAHEGVANRTLLIGPAGGFYSACGEDIYPACWSAIFAAEVLKKALKEKHLQDALNPYRHKWRTTLGDYLRGPHQNLRFLLPLIYRNPGMTARLAEAILLSKSVVR